MKMMLRIMMTALLACVWSGCSASQVEVNVTLSPAPPSVRHTHVTLFSFDPMMADTSADVVQTFKVDLRQSTKVVFNGPFDKAKSYYVSATGKEDANAPVDQADCGDYVSFSAPTFFKGGQVPNTLAVTLEPSRYKHCP